MPIKSAKEYREDARRVSALADRATSSDRRSVLLEMATNYEKLAQHAETLARLKFINPLD